MRHDTIIIGAGPAGIATAIQLKRAGHDFLLVDKGPVGGLLNNAHWVENYPGFPNGITGTELVEQFRKHIDSLGIYVVSDKVIKVERQDDLFAVKTEEASYCCKNLVVASGTKARELDSTIYSENVADKIHYKVYPLKGIRDKEIAIIGGGDAAFDYALNLLDNKISLLYKQSKCLPRLYKMVCKHDVIKLYPKTEVTKIEEYNEKLRIETANPYQKSIFAELVIPAIGRKPCIDFLDQDIQKHFLENQRIQNLYYVGDVSSGLKRQVAIAVGDGTKTAMEIIKESK